MDKRYLVLFVDDAAARFLRRTVPQTARKYHLKCEYCGAEYIGGTFPLGWEQCGVSDMGSAYDADSLASWCPEHTNQIPP